MADDSHFEMNPTLERSLQVLRLLARYHDVSLAGLEHVPREGPVVFVASHSLATYDALIGRYALYLHSGRLSWQFGDDLIFKIPGVRTWARRCGEAPHNPGRALELLREGNALFFVAGGMRESLRASSQRHTVEWRGRLDFARLAVLSGAPVVCLACPCADGIYDVYPNPVTDLVSRKLGLHLPLLRGLGPTWLPRAVSLVTAIGPPLAPAPKVDTADPDAVREAAAELLGRVQRQMENLLETAVVCDEGETRFEDLVAGTAPALPRVVSERGLADVLAVLRVAPAFRGLPENMLLALAGCARLADFEPGALLLAEAKDPARLHAVLSGELEAVLGASRDEVLGTLGPGDVCGRGAALGRPARASYLAALPTRTATWDRATLEQLYAEHPRLRVRLRTRLALPDRRVEIAALLRRSRALRSTSAVLVSRLLDAATLDEVERGHVLCRAGEPGRHFYLVVRGEVRILADEEAVERLLGPSDVFGEIALLGQQTRSATAIAATDAEILILEREAFESLRRASGSFRREIRLLSAERQGRPLPPEHPSEVVALHNASSFPTPALAELLREELESQVEGGVAVVEFGGARGKQAADGFSLHVPRASNREEMLRALDAVVHETKQRFVLLYESVPSETDERGLWEELLATRTASCVSFSFDASRRFPFEARPLGGVHYVELAETRVLGAMTHPFRAGSIRIAIGASSAQSIERNLLAPASRSALARLARALGYRSVGVALGGGAAWGMAHIALLRGLEDAGIPIDAIAGASMGALIAILYASRGREGLDEMEQMGGEMTRHFGAAVVSLEPAKRYLGAQLLAHRNLEELPLPTFPVAVNIDTGAIKVFRRGPVTDAGAASAALPALFATAFKDGARYVDGGVASNVPVGVLVQEGADFVIASNVVPPPTARPPRVPRAAWARAVEQVSPLGRAGDAARAMYLMLHSAGSRESEAADFVFQPDLSAFQPFEFHRTPQIVRAAERDIPHAIREIQQRYGVVPRRR